MVMRSFELLEPRSVAEACLAFAADREAKAIAGGTALLTILRQRLMSPKTLVNLKKISDGSDISFDLERGLRIGALATIHQIETSSIVQEHYPLIAEACHFVANIRVRNMATIGGNLAHADYQSDPPTVLAVLNASIETASAQGTRSISIERFQLGAYETALEPGELITAILIPPLPEGCKGTYLKFTTGSSGERPCAGIAALGRIENNHCRELRLAVGAISPMAVRIGAAEELAAGRPLSPEIIESIAAEAVRSVDPIEDIRGAADYKRHLVRVLVRRAIAAIAKGGKERAS
jgi:carbon-monoxide dehydrogenase medium subunit